MTSPPSRACTRSANPEVRMNRCTSVLAAALALALLSAPSRAATPPSGSIGPAAGTLSWDFGPVVAGQFTDVGIEDACPPGACDHFDPSQSLPHPPGPSSR